MILFENDWNDFPDAIIDLDTRNKSFIDMCYVLEDMGVKNNLFPLALHNPDLVGVDPFDVNNLTLSMKGAITEELNINPWYWFREVGRIPVQGSLRPVPVKANRGVIALWWNYFNHVTTFVIMPRQTGKSVGIALLDRYLLNWGLTRSAIHLLTKEDQLRRNDIERLKEYEDVLPEYLRRTVPRKDPNNQEYIYLSALDNKYESHVPRGDEKGAYKVGRGFTSANIRIDEFAYIKWLEATLTTILSTTNAAFVSARENNAHHGIVLATTAGKKDDRDGKFAYKILSESFPFTDLMYDSKDAADLKKMILANSSNGFAVNCTFGHRQLGVSDAQHYENIQKAMISGEDADRDYFNIWTSGGRGSPLTADQLDAIRLNQREDFIAEIHPKTRYLTRWYVSTETRERLMEEGNIAVGVDTSEGHGKDDIVMQYLDLTTLEVIGTCDINLTNIIDYSVWLFEQMMRWPKLVAIIERKSTGIAVIDQLLISFKMAGVNAFKRLFNRIVQDPEKNKAILDEIRRANKFTLSDMYVQYKSSFGFSTSGSGEHARSILYGQVLQNAVRYSLDRINDVKTIDQILELEVINNRVDHPKGGKDDCVVAWLLPHWLATYGNNLGYYGLDTHSIMSSTIAKKAVNQLSRLDLEQLELREELRRVSSDLSVAKDHFVIMRLEKEIANIAAKLVAEDGELYSVTELIAKTRENKKMGIGKKNTNAADSFLEKFQVVTDGGMIF